MDKDSDELQLTQVWSARWRGHPQEVADDVVATAVEFFGATAASLWWHDHDAARLIARHPGNPNVGQTLEFGKMPEIVDEIRAGTVQVIHRGGSSEGVDEWMQGAGIETSLRVPVKIEEAHGHVLGISWDRPYEPTDEVVVLAQRFADQAAIALLRALQREQFAGRALELSDNVAQALAVARTALDHGDLEQVQIALERAAAATQAVMSRLAEAGEGRWLRRREPADPGN